jgi:hypothetical protein
VERALAFIRTTISADGTVGVDGLPVAEYPTYAAAYALRCLVRYGDPADHGLRERLCSRLANEQLREQTGFDPHDPAYGGWSFGPRPEGSPGHVDLSITRHVLEALAEARFLARDEALARRETIADRAEQFLAYHQRDPRDLRPQPPDRAGPLGAIPPPSDGGFYLSAIVTAANKGGIATDAETGRRYFASYASATAEGLLALLAVGVETADPRVEAARAWLVERHPRIDIHEGIPENDPTGWQDGLRLCHLAVRAEAHAAMGGPEGWRESIRREFARFQRADGAVQNLAGALMKEDDPYLGTALAVIALAATER